MNSGNAKRCNFVSSTFTGIWTINRIRIFDFKVSKELYHLMHASSTVKSQSSASQESTRYSVSLNNFANNYSQQTNEEKPAKNFLFLKIVNYRKKENLKKITT